MREGFFKTPLFALVLLAAVGLGIWAYAYQHQYDPLYDAIDPAWIEREKASSTTQQRTSVQPEPAAPTGNVCTLIVDGIRYSIDPCDEEDGGTYGNDFGVGSGSKYFIYGVNTTDEVGGWWNGPAGASHAGDPLPGGKLTKVGNVYQNSRVQLYESGR